MRTLLINSNRFHQPWPVIPVGVCSVASSTHAAGHETQVVDLCFARDPAETIYRSVASFRPDVIGLSIRNIDNSSGFQSLFLLDPILKDVVKPLRAAFHGPIVIGGPAVGVSGEDILSLFDLNFAIRSDGEAAFVEFLNRLEHGISPEGIPGLVTRQGGKIVSNTPPELIHRLDDLPFPNPQRWIDLTPYRRYGSPLQVQTKRGCALHCTYCTYNQIEGRKWRLRDPRLVADEIETLLRETDFREIEFTDSTFNLPLSHAKDVLREIKGRRIKTTLRTMGMNPGAIDEELVGLMQDTGFGEVHVGAEAANDESLRSLGKNYTTEALVRTGRLLRGARIPVKWDLLVGTLTETPSSLKETFETISQIADPWDLVDVGVGIRAYKGAPVAETMKTSGRAAPTETFLRPVPVEPEALSLVQVRALTRQEALKRTNIFMYGEDEKTPLWLLGAVTWTLRRLKSKHPLFRSFIFLRKIQEWTGIGFIRRLLFSFQNRHILNELSQKKGPLV